jgi:hypothetical protein
MGMFGEKNKKSGDSARQDEEKARAQDQRAGDEAAVDKNAQLPALVEGAVDRAKEAGASEERVKFLEAQLEKLTRVVESLQNQRETDGKLNKGVRPEDLLPKYVQCGTCGQYLKVCNGKHVNARVLPWASENMEGFNGIQRNGVNYFGVCVVPAAMYQNIMCGVANYETMKRKSRFDLGKIRGWDKEVRMAEAQGFTLTPN